MRLVGLLVLERPPTWAGEALLEPFPRFSPASSIAFTRFLHDFFLLRGRHNDLGCNLCWGNGVGFNHGLGSRGRERVLDYLQDGVHEVPLAGIPVQGQNRAFMVGAVLDRLEASPLIEQVYDEEHEGQVAIVEQDGGELVERAGEGRRQGLVAIRGAGLNEEALNVVEHADHPLEVSECL